MGLLATSVVCSGPLDLESAARAQTADIAVAPGRLLGATRFQLAWLDWNAPRPVFLTSVSNLAVAHGVAAKPRVATAIVSVSSPTPDGRSWGTDGSDLMGVDLSTAQSTWPSRGARLGWIQQNYLRADRITGAYMRLVSFHATLPLTKALGAPELVSADGLRFVVPVSSVHAASNPKYFGRGRGATYINHTSAGSIGFFGFVVPGTLRDSMVILDGLLEQHTSLRPTTLVTDSASYSAIWTFAGRAVQSPVSSAVTAMRCFLAAASRLYVRCPRFTHRRIATMSAVP